MDILNTLFFIILMIILIPLTIFYFQLYHSLFKVIYFRNTCLEMIFEVIGCFIAAMFTLGIIWEIFKYLFGIVGGVLIFILKAIFVLAVICAIAFIIYFIAKKIINVRNQKNDKH